MERNRSAGWRRHQWVGRGPGRAGRAGAAT